MDKFCKGITKRPFFCEKPQEKGRVAFKIVVVPQPVYTNLFTLHDLEKQLIFDVSAFDYSSAKYLMVRTIWLV